MRILFLGDLHGNMVATEAMEQAILDAAPDEIWFLGDAVGKGPQNAETCDWVRANCHHFIGGNWDYGIGTRSFPADGYFWNQLGEERMAWLRSLPEEDEIILSGIRFRLFHGRPVSPLLKVQDDADLLSKALMKDSNGTQERFGGAVFADSHRPFFRTLDCGYIMNTGSVGNSMGVPNAHALILEGREGNVRAPLSATILSVPYDNQKAADLALKEDDLPHRDAYVREILTGIYSR